MGSASAYNQYANQSKTSGADQAALKMVNDTIGRSMQNIKFMLHSLSEACLKATSS